MSPSPSDPSTDERLSRWVREHAPAVRGYLLGVVRRPDLADDLTQEAFARAWRAQHQYREQGHERAFLLKIADRLAIDHLRRRRAEVQLADTAWREIEPASIEEEPMTALTRLEASDELRSALSQLSAPQARVLLLRFFGDLTFDEIARTLDCPLSTVLSHCRRGLIALRQRMTASTP